MEKRIKFIIVGLIGILVISLFINLSIYSAKQALEREREDLKRENTSLIQKIESSLQDNRRFQDRISSLNSDLDKVMREKEELQKKFELVTKERGELVEKLKEQKRPALVTEEQRQPVTEDAYWAGILKVKTKLELELDNIRAELKTAKINNEQLAREKSTLELEVRSLNREQEDLKRQLEYNQKIMDSLAQELVREKNDKLQINDSLKAIKNDNEVLRRQLKSLNSRKSNLEMKFADLEKENTSFNKRLEEMEMLLKERQFQIDSLKRQLDVSGSRQAISGEKEQTVELPPIVVRPQAETAIPQTSISLVGEVLAINKDNNFVVIDLGGEQGIKVGDTFRVYRNQDTIASIEVIQTRKSISACDIKKESVPIRVGDTVR